MTRTWYSEAFDADGRLRPGYSVLNRRLGWDPTQPSSPLAEQLRVSPFGDDTRIFPIPLVLGEKEFQHIRVGVAQRARALMRLFDDLFLGAADICAAGLGLTADLVEMVAETEHTTTATLRQLWAGCSSERIRFVYAPDLVRNASGSWVVIEDNIGCVGGSVDVHFVSSRYREAVGLPAARQRSDLAVASERLLGLLDRQHGSAVAVLGGEGNGSPFGLRIEENTRRRQLLAELSIPIRAQGDLTQCQIGKHPVPEMTVLNFAVDESWGSLFREPNVALLNAPGTAILGSKALLPLSDAIVRRYTGDDALLAAAPSRFLFAGLLPRGPGWVVKTAAGCGGSEVFMLDRLSSDQRRLLEHRLQDRSGFEAIAQRFVEPSQLVTPGPDGWDSYLVELRPFAYVLGPEVYVGEQPLGKAVSAYDPRRLNNVSAGASYVPVLCESG